MSGEEISSAPITIRRQALYGCTYAALGLGAIILPLSLVWIGYMSFYLSIVSFAWTLIFSIVMLVYKYREASARYAHLFETSTTSVHPIETQMSKTNSEAPLQPSSPTLRPAIVRLPTVISCFVISAFWFAGFAVLVYTQTIFWKFEQSQDGWNMSRAMTVESVLVLIEGVLFLTMGILGVQERERASTALSFERPYPIRTPRETAILECFWISLGLSVALFALSMVSLGKNSNYLCVAGFGLSVIVFGTTFALAGRQEKRRLAQRGVWEERRGASGEGKGSIPLDNLVPNQEEQQPPLALESDQGGHPVLITRPVLYAPPILFLIWLAALAAIIHHLVQWLSDPYTPDEEFNKLGPETAEICLLVGQMAILWVGTVLVKNERRDVMKAMANARATA